MIFQVSQHLRHCETLKNHQICQKFGKNCLFQLALDPFLHGTSKSLVSGIRSDTNFHYEPPVIVYYLQDIVQNSKRFCNIFKNIGQDLSDRNDTSIIFSHIIVLSNIGCSKSLLLQHLNNWTRASKITLTKKNGLFGKKSNCLITMTFSEMYIEYRYDTKKEY